MFIQIVSSQKRAEEQIPPVLFQIVRIYYLMEMLILDLKNTLTNQNLSMQRVGRPILEHLELLKENLLPSTVSNHLDRQSQDLEVILARVSFKRNTK